MKAATVALVVKKEGSSSELLETLSDDREITIFEEACQMGEEDPLELIYQHRKKQNQEDDEFGEYVEELLSQPFLRSEVQQHAVQWLKSKIRIEEYQRSESEAARIIAQYAYRVFQDRPDRRDFFLEGPTAQVRIRVFVFSKDSQQLPFAA